jgi:hypothetical protein
MPIHDWTRVDTGLFHAFHPIWTVNLCNALNAGRLPEGCFVIPEQVIGGPAPDLVTPNRPRPNTNDRTDTGGLAVAERPPQARFRVTAPTDPYTARANRVAAHHSLGDVVAVIEIVSPGDKESRHAIRAFAEKARALLDSGIHLLVVDRFPPSPRDLQGIHKAIWDEIQDDPFELPPDKPLTAASYMGGSVKTPYAEPVAVGEPLPEMPIFLSTYTYVPAPLEASYQESWGVTPAPIREPVEGTAR